MSVHLSLEQARRIAVRAQLLEAPRPTDLVAVVRQLTRVQLEPTAPIAPTAELLMRSRLGDEYEFGELERVVDRHEDLFELDLMVRPMEDLALFRAEMELGSPYEATRRWLDDNEEFHDDVVELLEVDGPLTARGIPDTSIVSWPSTGWNNNRNVMMMLQCLMMAGEVATAGRSGRDRLWDLAERVYHSDIPTVPIEDALQIRAERRLRAQGLFRLGRRDREVGEPATVEGLPGTWRVDPTLDLRALDHDFEGRTVLLSPFDGLIQDRKRMAELFEFEYALEMYKPVDKRRWGYYALPILHGDRLVGKVDATANHDRGALVVHAVHEDSGFTPDAALGVDNELASLAGWLGLDLEVT